MQYYDIYEDVYGLWLVIFNDRGIVRECKLHDPESPNYDADMPAMRLLAEKLGCTIKEQGR
jgi:hypothetical protein